VTQACLCNDTGRRVSLQILHTFAPGDGLVHRSAQLPWKLARDDTAATWRAERGGAAPVAVRWVYPKPQAGQELPERRTEGWTRRSASIRNKGEDREIWILVPSRAAQARHIAS
jgi:hypothetical protein